MGFKCIVMGYDISDTACETCGIYCKFNPNCEKKEQGGIKMEGESDRKSRVRNILFDNFGSYVAEDSIEECLSDLEKALGNL